MLRALGMVFLLSILAAPVAAQDPQTHGTTSRGRVGNAMNELAAGDVARRLGVDCDVRSADYRGRDGMGNRHFEVACRDSMGYLLIENTQAYSCLALQGQNESTRDSRSRRDVPTCRLNANRDPVRQLRPMAQRAGIDCTVDAGFAIGRSESGNPLYEIGCRNGLGAWLEQSPRGFVVTDCLSVRAQGQVCRYTSRDEELQAFSGWLRDSSAPTCRPINLRSMGRNENGESFHEVDCAGKESMVVVLSPYRQVTRTIPCAEAARVGGGCISQARSQMAGPP